MFEKKHFTVQAGTALVKKHQTVPYLHFWFDYDTFFKEIPLGLLISSR
jgi:hypothetical protein